MGNEINMKQYGLSETFVKSVYNFSDLTVARILSQEKGNISASFFTWRKMGRNIG